MFITHKPSQDELIQLIKPIWSTNLLQYFSAFVVIHVGRDLPTLHTGDDVFTSRLMKGGGGGALSLLATVATVRNMADTTT